MFETLAGQAFALGILSAVSLPLGAITAFFWRPKDKIIAFLLAFGSGALLAALTIDLVGTALAKDSFYSLALGCILGGLLFVILNQILNKKGGFLRKAATTIHYLRKNKIKNLEQVLKKTSRVALFHHLTKEELQYLVPHIISRSYKKGSTIFCQGKPEKSLFIVEKGAVELVDEKNNRQQIGIVKENEVIGTVALFTEKPPKATAYALTDTRLWVIEKKYFDSMVHTCPQLVIKLENLIQTRILKLQQDSLIKPQEAKKWFQEVVKSIDKKNIIPSEAEVQEAVSQHKDAPFTIWLGILLDGIPESLVIGASLLHAHISFSLIAGLFLSNYPEALSSSAGMSHQGYSLKKIFWMWTSLMIITGIGALLGNIFFAGAPQMIFSIVEGMAAGAMLTMIAETMLPDAYYKGGSITGFSTLIGFLAAIYFKTLE